MFLSTPPSRVATTGEMDDQGQEVFLSTPPSRVATSAGGLICTKKLFLSTPPSRVATRLRHFLLSYATSFYPRHPRGWRRGFAARAKGLHRVSIHATLAGGDGLSNAPDLSTAAFLSTPPSRVATRDCPHRDRPQQRFYPRHPRGWRPIFGFL